MKKGKKITIIVCSAVGMLVIACLIGLLVAGSKWGIPPFGGLFDMRIAKLAGNADEYAVENAQPVEGSVHGWGAATGTPAEGWINGAAKFWKDNR